MSIGHILGALIGLGIYFIPSIVARVDDHRQFRAIVVFNLFFGWTVAGWALALVWACSMVEPRE
jgi:hypothetical protein